MDNIKIYDWLHKYDFQELKITDNIEQNIFLSKLLFHIHKTQHTNNIHNTTRFIMLDTLANELEIDKCIIIRYLKKLRLKKLIYLSIDDFGFRINKHNEGLAKAFGVTDGASRAKAKLTTIGEEELKKICINSNIPFLREYKCIIG